MDAEEDGELMLRYARGDLRAFERLYRRYRRPLYRYLSRHTRNPEAANDLFQEVWSKLIASRDRYEPRAQFRTFLYRIAHNSFIDYCRRNAVRGERGGDAPADEDWAGTLPAPDEDRPDMRLQALQTIMRFRAAVASLPPEQRDVFLLYEESGLSLEEIAVVTGVGMETAKSRLRYAVAKLRRALGPAPQPAEAAGRVVEEQGA
jgi:RNA polymerase sigma-70 factor, ECF subfamily